MALKQRKLWSDESMKAAVQSVEEGHGLREASRLFNVPVETLRRRVTGKVDIDCRPGPRTVLTKEEEDKIAQYLIKMADMGYGLTPDSVMHMVYDIVENFKRPHPFKNEKAGRSWYEGFRKRHPNLTIRQPQPLSYCRALSARKDVISYFFGKLGSIYGKLNLLLKPMQVFNTDETGVSIVHKPGKVIAELGRHYVYSVTSAEKGKTHTIISCVLSPCMVYPRKRNVPDNLREGAIPGTLFCHTESGWVNKDTFLEWFNFFLRNIPPARPVALILDGHTSHVSIELIELARANDIHILCIPSHTSHVLQPLDVGVFKSFKTHFSKACGNYLAKHPGRVITTDVIASMIAAAWPDSFTPNNIMGGFRKSGVFPFNPGAIDDKQLSPSGAVCLKASVSHEEAVPDQGRTNESVHDDLFTPEKERLFEQRFTEGYNIKDPEYEVWLRIRHPVDVRSEPFSYLQSESTPSLGASAPQSTPSLGASAPESTPSLGACGKSTSSKASASDVLSEILVLPQPKAPSKRKKKAINSMKAVCITDEEVLGEMKAEKAAKSEEQKLEKEKQLERERKKIEREAKKKKEKLEKDERKNEREESERTRRWRSRKEKKKEKQGSK